MKTSVVLINLGTPDAPTFWAIRRYLKEFLSDPYVIDVPRWKWWPILNLIILNIRPFQSAKKYREIWTTEGSPLLVNTEKIQKKLQAALPNLKIGLFMQYGSPKDQSEGIRLPLYPQYSRTTYRDLPDTSYHDHPLYIKALQDSVEAFWQKHGKPEKLILSYHGLPKRYVDEGDPYLAQCTETSMLLRKVLGVDENFAPMTFQSRVGFEDWLSPYTEEVLTNLKGKSVQVICPGFACDCLETLEEIVMRHPEVSYIPALNAGKGAIDLYLKLIDQAC